MPKRNKPRAWRAHLEKYADLYERARKTPDVVIKIKQEQNATNGELATPQINAEPLYRCGHCQKHKPANQFNRRSLPYQAINHNGLQNWCKDCQKTSSRAQADAKKAIRHERVTRYYA